METVPATATLLPETEETQVMSPSRLIEETHT